MGQHLVTHDPCDPSDFRDHLTHDPLPIDPFSALVQDGTTLPNFIKIGRSISHSGQIEENCGQHIPRQKKRRISAV